MNKKLHILFLSSWYPSKVKQTNGNFIQRHAEAIAKNHEVTLIYVVTDEKLKHKSVSKKIINGVKTIIIYLPKQPYRLYKYFLFGREYINQINNLKKPNIIHANVTFPIGLIALYLKKMKGVPYIVSEHWSGYVNGHFTNENWFIKLLHKKILRNASVITPVSDFLQSAMINSGLKGNYKVVGNVVDTTLFKPINNVNKKDFVITHISTFDSAKNIDGILRVIKKLSKTRSDFIFKIIIDGNLEGLNNKIFEYNIPNHLVKTSGNKTYQEIAQILQQTSLYISFSNYETFGIIPLEAIACGCPVIATKTSVLSEIVKKKYITLINKNDENALLKALEHYLDYEINFNKLEMHTFVSTKFSSSTICNKFNILYQNIVRA